MFRRHARTCAITRATLSPARILRFSPWRPVKKRLITGVALRQPQSDRVTVVACTFTRTLVLLWYRALDVREP
jgi:hypothetical protein